MLQPAQLLLRVAEALNAAADQAERAGDGAAAWRWLTVPIVAALQGACVMALAAGSENSPMAVGQGEEGRLAPPGVLLKRVRSEKYMPGGKHLELTSGQNKAIQSLIDCRNACVHMDTSAPRDVPTDRAFLTAAEIIRFLLIKAPVFDAALLAPEVARIESALQRYERAVCAAHRS